MNFADIGDDTALSLDEETERIRKTQGGSLKMPARERRASASIPPWQVHPAKKFTSQSIVGDHTSLSPYHSPDTLSAWAERSDSSVTADNDFSDGLTRSLKSHMHDVRSSLIEPVRVLPQRIPSPRLSDPDVESVLPSFLDLQRENEELKIQLATSTSEIAHLREALQKERGLSASRLNAAVRQLRKGYNDKLRESCTLYYRQVKKAFEETTPKLEAMVAAERQQKEELLEACDRFFDKKLDDLSK